MELIKEDSFFDYLNESFVDSVRLRISKGCNNSCTFCSIPDEEGREVSFTPIPQLEDLLSLLWEQGVRHLEFVDDNFLQYVESVSRLLITLDRRGQQFAFSFSSPVKLILKNQKHLISLRQQGLRCVNLKVINSNQDVLYRYGMKMTAADQHYAIQILQALRCQIQPEYILFEPLTTIDHLHNDLVFLEKNKLLGITPFTDILTSCLDLEKETPIGFEYRSRKLYLPSSDPYIPYQIMDERAQTIYHWLAYFSQEFGPQWKEIEQLLLDLRITVANQKSNWIVTNMGQELMYIIYDLRLAPYDLFKALLSCADEGDLDSITTESINFQSNQRLQWVKDQYWSYRKYYRI